MGNTSNTSTGDSRVPGNEPYARNFRKRSFLNTLDGSLRRRLPRPAYESMLGGYHGLRKLTHRNPGRGRVLPDFLIIGAAKTGTTSMSGWLADHLFIAPAQNKELNYFSYHHYRGTDWYRHHFPREREREAFAAEHGRPFLTGEASPSYLLHPRAPERVAKLLPDVKLIVQMRDPVDRAYSQFQMRRRDGEEPLESFAAAVDAEAERLEPEMALMDADPRYNSYDVACWSYLARSRYAEQLERWLEHFPREQFHFLTLEGLAAEPQATLDGVHEFLGLPPRRADSLPALFRADYDPLPAETRARLTEYFRPHNKRLYELLGTDYGWERPR